MAIRTNATNVRKVVKVPTSISSLDPFIETASLLVDIHCAASGYSDALLEMIERWLAAHFLVLYIRLRASEKAGPVSASYESGTLSTGLKATVQGQQALLFDSKGGLAKLQTQQEAGVSTIFAAHLWEDPSPCR